MLALAEEPTRSLYAADYAERHDLPAKPALQRADRRARREGDRRAGTRAASTGSWSRSSPTGSRSEQEALGLKDELRGR